MSKPPPAALPRRPSRGLGLLPAWIVPDSPRAQQVQRRWTVPTLLAFALTIPAFYLELLHEQPPPVSALGYLAAALTLLAALLHTGWRTHEMLRHLRARPFDVLLALGLLLAALLPPSSLSPGAFVLRLAVAFMILGYSVWMLQHRITRGSLAWLLLLAMVVLALCGAGFWWLEPGTPSFGEGVWLAFTTAATVGFGDVVPTVPASKVFSVFVVLLGYAVLTMVTAAIAAAWVEDEERRIEHEIVHELHREIRALRAELAQMRAGAPASQREPM